MKSEGKIQNREGLHAAFHLQLVEETDSHSAWNQHWMEEATYNGSTSHTRELALDCACLYPQPVHNVE